MALVFACRRHHQFRLGGVVATRFFHVDMFACLTTKDGGRCVPKVGRCNGDGIEMGILQHAPQIGDAAAWGGLFFCHCGECVGGSVVVHVTNVGDLDIGNLEKIIHVRHAAAKPHHSDAERVVGLVGGTERVALGQAGGSCGDGGLCDKPATIEWRWHNGFNGFGFKTWPSVPRCPRLAKRIGVRFRG